MRLNAMPSSAALRIQIEQAFENRYPAVLTPSPRTIQETAQTGLPELDEMLKGGFPVGAISELIGTSSSGRTSIAMAFLAQRTSDKSRCAWVDVSDAFDPASAAANGVILKRLLWVRCYDSRADQREDKPLRAGNNKPWTRLDQAIRATDLLLQTGGFAAIVLDLADISIEHARRIPLATWFRFRQATDRTRCSLLVLGKASCAQSSAAALLECKPFLAEDSNNTLLCGFRFSAQRGRERFAPVISLARKPPASCWFTKAQWDSERYA
jgi:hypothetical protein